MLNQSTRIFGFSSPEAEVSVVGDNLNIGVSVNNIANTITYSVVPNPLHQRNYYVTFHCANGAPDVIVTVTQEGQDGVPKD